MAEIVSSGMVLISSAFDVNSEEIVLDTQVSSVGVLNVLAGGLADSTTVYEYGGMYVSAGGSASNSIVVSSGVIVEDRSGTVDNTVVSSSGEFYVYNLNLPESV